jgi:hypothetical protein
MFNRLCRLDENCALLGYYAANRGNLSPFWDNLPAPFGGVKNPKESKSCTLCSFLPREEQVVYVYQTFNLLHLLCASPVFRVSLQGTLESFMNCVIKILLSSLVKYTQGFPHGHKKSDFPFLV